MAGFVIGISFSSVYAGIPWGTDDIADDAITSEKIKDRQIKGPDILGNAIKSAKIKDGEVMSADIATGAVTADKIATGAVDADAIATNAVGSNEIADDAITSEKIGKKEVKRSDIKNNAIRTEKIQDGTITLADLAPGVDKSAQIAALEARIDELETLTADSAPQVFHLKGTSTSSGNVTVNGLSKTFTLSEATTVFVSSDVETEYSTPDGQFARARIVIDSSIVAIGPFLDDDESALMFFPSHVSWTGQLSAGTHTISTHVFASGGGTVCPNFGQGCNMNILVLGQ